VSAGTLLESWTGLEAEATVLALDYDGTLVPIVERPEDARPDEDLIALLAALGGEEDLHVILLSGRPVETLAAWLPLPDLTLVGTHGAEWRPPRGAEALPLLAPPQARGAAARAAGRLREALAGLPGAQVEAKPFGVAAHYRRVSPEHLETFEARLAEAVAELCPPFELQEGKRVRELRWPGVEKGRALEELRRRMGWQAHPVLALGDDRTDESTFASLGARDLSLHVGAGPTRAAALLPHTEAARSLLRGLPRLRRQTRTGLAGGHRRKP
jgi:trehalose-phosphatase